MSNVDICERKVYLAEDISRILGIGRSRTYMFLDEVHKRGMPFRVIKIGKLIRVPKTEFDAWLLEGGGDIYGQ